MLHRQIRRMFVHHGDNCHTLYVNVSKMKAELLYGGWIECVDSWIPGSNDE